MPHPDHLDSAQLARLAGQLARLRDGLARLRGRASSGDLERELEQLHRLAQQAVTVVTPDASEADSAQPFELAPWLERWAAPLGDDLAIQLQLADGLPGLRLDRGALEHALSQLIDNARAAGARKLMLNARTVNLSLAETPPDIDPGDYLCLELTDDGEGASGPAAPRARGSGFGTGAGSATDGQGAYGFARAHGGTLRQQSRRAGGTSVALYLPLSRVAAAPPKGADGAPDVQPRRILVVDDEPYARSAARRVLRALGHEVLEASGGNEACSVARAGGHLDLLLTDLNMPEMDGFELARQLRQERPALPILYMCGYPPETIEGAPADAQFIEKPFTYEDLVYKVGHLLEQREGAEAPRDAS